MIHNKNLFYLLQICLYKMLRAFLACISLRQGVDSIFDLACNRRRNFTKIDAQAYISFIVPTTSLETHQRHLVVPDKLP
jgi:hypothetical protein